MPGRQPDFRATTKDPETGKFVDIGAVWTRAQGGFSGKIDRLKIPQGIGDKLSLYLFPNIPTAKAQPAPDLKPAA
jgi:hypothetical protein